MTEHDDGDGARPWSAVAAPADRVQVPGDEREQTVLLEAAARGNRVLIDALLMLSLVTALFGNWLVPAALLAILVLSGRLADDYAGDRDVDAPRLADAARLRRPRLRSLLALLALVLTFAAMSYIGFTGHGLLGAPDVFRTGPEAAPLVRSAAGTLPLVAIAGIIALAARDAFRRRRHRRSRSSE